MVAGSAASTYYSEPRTTQDIDIVIDPDRRSLQAFVGALDPARYYVGDSEAALARRGQFNVIDTTSGWKVDLIVCRDRPFSRQKLARRRQVEIEGLRVSVASPEDTILAKLEWGELSGSSRQRRDVQAMVGPLEMASTSSTSGGGPSSSASETPSPRCSTGRHHRRDGDCLAAVAPVRYRFTGGRRRQPLPVSTAPPTSSTGAPVRRRARWTGRRRGRRRARGGHRCRPRPCGGRSAR